MTNAPTSQLFIIISQNIHTLLHFLEFVILLTALVLVDLPAYRSVYPIIDRYSPHAFTIFTTLLQIVTFCAFFCADFYAVLLRCYTGTSRRFHYTLLTFFFILHLLVVSHTVTNFLQRDGWLVLRFLSLYVTLLIVFFIGKLHVMWLRTLS